MGDILVDGASREAVDWYLRTVYEAHAEHFGAELGRTIVGFFYDEPETHGDWGTEVIPLLRERGVDWKAALVAWKLQLAGEEHVAARYQYQDALAEAWGRTLYGGIERWCRERGLRSMGHFLEHKLNYLSPRLCAGNAFQLQKYSSMGGIDAVFEQFTMGRHDTRNYKIWQTPKLGSSISHAYGKQDDLAMVEIFGGMGQDLSYREMKWLTDHMHVSGVNLHVPHSFNPSAPHDDDCPPYFFNGSHEPRWPLYRVYADYTSRLSLMLSEGRHVCSVAVLYPGTSCHFGKFTTPEFLTSALQDGAFDCDWLPYDVFEETVEIASGELRLHDERYRALVVPGVDVIPHEVLAKARAFLDEGGVVIGYRLLPSSSATPGRTAEDIGALRAAIWGDAVEPSTSVCLTNVAGGRSYFLPLRPTTGELRNVLAEDAGIHPELEVLAGDSEDLLHVLHRVKVDRDVFFVCNQIPDGPAKRFELRARVRGHPERWDVVRDEITAVPFRRTGDEQVDFTLDLEPLESALLVFHPEDRGAPDRIDSRSVPARDPIVVERIPSASEGNSPTPGDGPWSTRDDDSARTFSPVEADPFEGRFALPAEWGKSGWRVFVEMDGLELGSASLRIDGEYVGGFIGAPFRLDVTDDLAPGPHTILIEPRAPESVRIVAYP